MGQRDRTAGQTRLLWPDYCSGYAPLGPISCIYAQKFRKAIQTLGEEYTDIWQYSSFTHSSPPSRLARASVVLLPALPGYILARWGTLGSLGERYPNLTQILKNLPTGVEVATEINLAIFYMRGTYYDLVKRFLGIRHVRCVNRLL